MNIIKKVKQQPKTTRLPILFACTPFVVIAVVSVVVDLFIGNATKPVDLKTL